VRTADSLGTKPTSGNKIGRNVTRLAKRLVSEGAGVSPEGRLLCSRWHPRITREQVITPEGVFKRYHGMRC